MVFRQRTSNAINFYLHCIHAYFHYEISISKSIYYFSSFEWSNQSLHKNIPRYSKIRLTILSCIYFIFVEYQQSSSVKHSNANASIARKQAVSKELTSESDARLNARPYFRFKNGINISKPGGGRGHFRVLLVSCRKSNKEYKGTRTFFSVYSARRAFFSGTHTTIVSPPPQA